MGITVQDINPTNPENFVIFNGGAHAVIRLGLQNINITGAIPDAPEKNSNQESSISSEDKDPLIRLLIPVKKAFIDEPAGTSIVFSIVRHTSGRVQSTDIKLLFSSTKTTPSSETVKRQLRQFGDYTFQVMTNYVGNVRQFSEKKAFQKSLAFSKKLMREAYKNNILPPYKSKHKFTVVTAQAL